MTTSQTDAHKNWIARCPLALWDFIRNNKHCIHLSTTKTSISLFLLIINHISIDHFCSAFCRFPILICNKAAADSSVQAQTEMVKNGRRNTSLPHVFSSE